MMAINNIFVKYTTSFLLILSLVYVGECDGIEKVGNNILKMTSSINTAEGLQLKLKLTNNLDRPLSFFNGFLSRNRIVLIVVKDKPLNNSLEEFALVNNPGPGQVNIGVGEIFVESIELDDIYPSLSDDLKKHDILLFWSVQLNSIGENAISKSFSGNLRIERLKK